MTLLTALALIMLVIVLFTHCSWWIVALVAGGVIHGVAQIRGLTTKARRSPSAVDQTQVVAVGCFEDVSPRRHSRGFWSFFDCFGQNLAGKATMITATIGLLASAALYLLAIYGFVWAGRRRMEWGARHGIVLAPEPKMPAAVEIWNRHRVDMTLVYGAVFVALALMGLTIWQRLGFAAFSALVFSYLWISNNSTGLPGVSSGQKVASDLGYWCLAVADWFGYFGVLCFGTAIVIEVF